MAATIGGLSTGKSLSPAGEGGRNVPATRRRSATPPASPTGEETATDVPVLSVAELSPAGGDGQERFAAQMGCAVPPALLAEIRETHRQRQDLLRAELRLTNQIEAIHRRLTGLTKAQRAAAHRRGTGHTSVDAQRASAGADDAGDPGLPDDQRTSVAREAGGEGGHTSSDARRSGVPLADLAEREALADVWALPLADARALLVSHRKPLDKRLELLVKELPAWSWGGGVRGFGALSLAQIVGETGDLAGYANPAKVWKRMGLAVMPDGTRQRRVAGEGALEHGYSPQRRALMYVVAENLVKLNRDGPYRAYYLAEKERQREKLPDASPAHIDNRAKRHLAKRLLRDLWRAWRDQDASADRQKGVPATPAAGPARLS
jgi:hypothetical protein